MSYTCTTCGKQYQHSSHLRRHEATHNDIPGFTCMYCNKTYARRDVYRKHILTCPKNDEKTDLPKLRRGQKRRACESCFHRKVSCDRANPCGRCILRGLVCHFKDTSVEGSDVPLDGFSAATSSASAASPPAFLNRQYISGTPFLQAITDTAAQTLLEAFANETSVNDRVPEMSIDIGGADKNPFLFLMDEAMIPNPWSSTSIFDIEHVDLDRDNHILGRVSPTGPSITIPALTADGDEVMQRNANIIIQELQGLHSDLIVNDPSYNEDFDVEKAKAVFSPTSMKIFIVTFFRLGHVHMPLVHMPSFGTNETSAVLILALSLGGALRAPPRDDTLCAWCIFRIAEEYIFRRLAKIVASNAAGKSTRHSNELLEAFQAALLMQVILFLINDAHTRRRSRLLRVPVLVDTARTLGLMSTKRSENPSWNQFVFEETCIRIATWTALSTWNHCFLLNDPPLITIAEMECNLPAPSDLWDASNATEYETKIQTRPPNYPSSIRDFVGVLMQEKSRGIESFPIGYISVHDMNLAIISLCTMIVNAHTMFTMSSSAPAFLAALSRWEELWDMATASIHMERLSKMGIARHSGEICWFARRIVEVSVSGQGLPAFLRRIGHDSMAEVHEFIVEYLKGQ
ncbi:Transcription factor [Cladobotryum mycophilum]|uniref:Transcription factor n=1 Tax=Cladobotryum mycophilum TaxID=491253 RepID=A0ABR0SR57_9HYPO